MISPLVGNSSSGSGHGGPKAIVDLAMQAHAQNMIILNWKISTKIDATFVDWRFDRNNNNRADKNFILFSFVAAHWWVFIKIDDNKLGILKANDLQIRNICIKDPPVREGDQGQLKMEHS